MTAYTNTSTFTKSYTRTRIAVLDDHFELFLRCSNMKDATVEKMLLAVERHELDAVGIYLQEGTYRISEVEFRVDWDKHTEMVRLSGELFNTDIGGWKNGVAPEAYIVVQKLVKLAKEKNLKVRSWISVSDRIRSCPSEHKRVCENLGYSYGSPAAPWKYPPNEQIRQINGLDEGRVITRVGRV